MDEIREIEKTEEEIEQGNILRPKKLVDFVGQSALKKNLSIFIESSKIRGKNLDHVIFCGPPGLGKTTLANIIANEMGVGIRTAVGPMLSKTGDLAAILTNLNAGDVLFIDEIHRLPIAVEEVLYSAMEDFRIDIIIGQGPSARTIKIDINPFTLVGATTRMGLISNPLRDRFGIVMQLEFYNEEELGLIIRQCCGKMEIGITKDAEKEIAKCSRGTPRIAIRLTKRVIDVATFLKINEIDINTAKSALKQLGINEFGLDKLDMKYLRFMYDNYGMNPVGLGTVAVALSEDKNTIEETIEPFLIKNGLIERTPRGRVLTKKCIDILRG